MRSFLPRFMALLLVASADRISDQCRVQEEVRVVCKCIGNEEFFLPEGYNYENVTSLRLSSCVSANLHFSSLTEASRIEEIIVQNISERLILELFVTSRKMRRFELTKIHKIPLITHDTFTNLRSIEQFTIEDTFIENFEERFSDIVIKNFSLINVTIAHMSRVGFSEIGENLRLINTDFQNVTGFLTFGYFSRVEVRDSKFALQKPGHLLIEGDVVLVENSVFSNASTNLVAASKITVNGSCADGKSSLRLSSDRVASMNNRLPTEIVYTRSKQSTDTEYFFNRNNTVCIAGNCRCPKTSGQSRRYQPTVALLLSLQVLFSFLTWTSR